MSRSFPCFPLVALCGMLAACSSSSGTAGKQPGGQMSVLSREHIASAAEASGNNELALSMYAEAAAAAPANSDVRLRYADVLARTGQIESARDVLTRGLANTSEPLKVRHGLGVINVEAGLHDQAIAQMDKILAAQPQDVPALVDKAVALDLEGKHIEAQQLYLQANQLLPGDPAIANNLALSYALQGRTAEARNVLRPFMDAANVPERMKVMIQIVSAGTDAPHEDAPNAPAVHRLALALAGAMSDAHKGGQP